MRISSINSNNLNKYNSFQSSARLFYDKMAKKAFCQGQVSNYTYPFRKDIDDWFSLGRFIIDNFKDKQNINLYSLACSDGSEAYTMALVLKDIANGKKMFPIIAVDKDINIIEQAKSERINLTIEDLIRMEELLGRNQSVFSDIKEETIVKDVYGNVINDWDYEIPKFYSFKVDDNLRTLVNFKAEDLLTTLTKITDDSNTFIACRNVFPYLTSAEQAKLVSLLRAKLKKGSLVAIGKYDERVNAEHKLLVNNFEETIFNNVYRKI